MMMVTFLGVVVNKPTVHFAFDHASLFLQQVQGTINGRFVDAGCPCIEEINELISSKVRPVIMNILHDKTTLRGHLKTFLLENSSTTHCNCNQLLLYTL